MLQKTLHFFLLCLCAVSSSYAMNSDTYHHFFSEYSVGTLLEKSFPLRRAPMQEKGGEERLQMISQVLTEHEEFDRVGEPILRQRGERKSIKIAIVSDGASLESTNINEFFKTEIEDLLETDYLVIFEEDAFTGDWSYDEVNRLVEKAFADPEIDIVLATGLLASHNVSHERQELPKPTFAPLIINPEIQELPLTMDNTSGVKNLNYIIFSPNMVRNIPVMKQLFPIKKLTILMNPYFNEAIPNLIGIIDSLGEMFEIEMNLTPVTDLAKETLAAITEGTDAVYIYPLTELTTSQLEILFDKLNERNIPSFSLFRQNYIDNGALVSNSRDDSLPQLARKTALHVQQALFGVDPGQMSVAFQSEDHLVINLQTAHTLRISPPWDLLLQADVYHPKDDHTKEKGFPEVIEWGIEENRNLAAAWRGVTAGSEDVRRAQSFLLPHVEIGSLTRMIDRDRALSSFGREPERAVSGTARASQVVYSNEIWGNYWIEEYLQQGRCFDYATSKLDLIFEVSRAYFNLLRVQTVEEIQRNNLKLTRVNLKVAKEREAIGVARVSEVYRWESQISSNQSSVITAHNTINTVRVMLNKLLNRPQDEAIELKQVTLDEPFWVIEKEWFANNIDDDQALEVLSEYAVERGFELSPEISQLKSAIYAQGEKLGITERAFWTPTLKLLGEITRRFATGGAGSRPPSNLPPGIPINFVDKTDWFVGFDVSFPLYEGGRKCADNRKARQELVKLSLELEALVERIEETIRTNINRAASSFKAIGLLRAAARSAEKNLELVAESYSKGTTGIIDLIDAQNQALVANLVAVNSVYDFLIDLMSVQRSIGEFDVLLPDYERVERRESMYRFFNEKMRNYYAKH